MARDVALLIRLDGREKAAFQDAAKIAGIGMSAWARERLRLAAVRELEAAGRKNPLFSDEGDAGADDND